MPRGCFIGIDQGSGSTKALVVDINGELLYQTRRNIQPPLRDGLRVEQNPLEILQTVEKVLAESVQWIGASDCTLLGIGLSCQRSSCLIWDETTVEPLSTLVSWRDTRGIDLVRGLSEHEAAISAATGLPLTPYYSASKMNWLKDAVPSGKQRTAIFGTLSSFLVQRLTNGDHAMIDHTNAARTQLMNIHTLSWDEGLKKLFGLDDIRLPEITPTAHDFGMVRSSSSEAPLLASIGDQQAAMLGLGVLNRGQGGINYGTGGFLVVNTGNSLTPVKGLMTSIHYSMDHDTSYILEGSVNAAGDALEWLRTRLGLFSNYAEVDDLCWKALSDVVVFIGLNGTGAPHWETGLSSSIHGLTAESAPADIVRGTVEGIAFFMKDIVEAVKATGLEPRSFAVSGGLLTLSYLMQIQADILSAELRTSGEQEVSALGAAFLAGMKYGAWTRDDIAKLAHYGETVNGEKNPGLERRYTRWKALHRLTGEIDRI